MDINNQFQSLFIIWLVPCALSFVLRAEAWKQEGFSKPVQEAECHIGHNVGQGMLQAKLNSGWQYDLKNLR